MSPSVVRVAREYALSLTIDDVPIIVCSTTFLILFLSHAHVLCLTTLCLSGIAHFTGMAPVVTKPVAAWLSLLKASALPQSHPFSRCSCTSHGLSP